MSTPAFSSTKSSSDDRPSVDDEVPGTTGQYNRGFRGGAVAYTLGIALTALLLIYLLSLGFVASRMENLKIDNYKGDQYIVVKTKPLHSFYSQITIRTLYFPIVIAYNHVPLANHVLDYYLSAWGCRLEIKKI
ncbi:MAG: hypothetical protein ACAI35_07675 [Candidatus Methylacidiphilales bacterium]